MPSRTSSSGFTTGSGRNRTASTKLNIALLTPMPSASVSTATAVKPGFCASCRTADRRSFMARSPCNRRATSSAASRRIESAWGPNGGPSGVRSGTLRSHKRTASRRNAFQGRPRGRYVACRQAKGRLGGAMTTLWQDLLYAGRRLVKSPGFALAAVLTLALGIGANTAIFQLLEAVQLRSLPVKDPAGLVEVRIADMEGARGAFNSWHAGASNPLWEEIRRRQEAVSGVFAWSSSGL